MRNLIILIFLCIPIIAYADSGIEVKTASGGGCAEGADCGFGNMTATSIQVGIGTAAAPSVDIGGGNDGFFKQSGVLKYSLNGTATNDVILGPSGIQSGNTNGPFMLNSGVATATNPVWVFIGDDDTGVGKAGADQLSLIAGGTEALRTYTTYSEFYPSGSGQVKIYDDGSLAIAGSMTLSNMTTIFADYSAINNMNQILCDATAGDIDIHIVSASGTKGTIGNVMKIDASGNNCIIEPAGAETISGAANKYISARWDNITYFSDNTNLLIR